eukprot:gene8035-12501_t
MIFSLITSILSLLSFLKIVQKRRELQQKNPERIGLLTAATHTVFDGIEKITNELDKVNEIIDERSSRLLIEPKKRFLLENSNQKKPILRIESTIKKKEQDEMLKSIPTFNNSNLSN